MRPKAKSRSVVKTPLTEGQKIERLAQLLTSLLSHHRFEFLKPLAIAVRQRDWPNVLRTADSLAGTKYASATEHFVANQLSLLIRKYPFQPSQVGTDPELAARKTFARSEKRCARMNNVFASIQARDHQLGSWRYREYDVEARKFFRGILGKFPVYDRILSQCDFGGGASLGIHGDATHVLRKISSDEWTIAPSALEYAYKAVCLNHHLVENILEAKNGLYCFDPSALRKRFLDRLAYEGHNKISFVPKTAKTERTIAVEPLLNGFVQKGIDQEMRKLILHRTGIDLSNQESNQRLAREGSIDDSEDGFVTIDMKSASDSVSCGLVRFLLPEEWFRFLNNTRSKYYKMDETLHEYSKFCSMGNGFCFPLETLVFASACHAVGAGLPMVDYSIYGDDIIVRKKHSGAVLRLLRHWGFTANLDKTFLEGPFRESCGADWFGGEDVRPYTLDHDLGSLPNLFKFLNLTNRNSRTQSFFALTRDLAISWIPAKYRFFRPFKGNPETGIDSLGDEYLTSEHCAWRHKRWNWRELVPSSVEDLDMMEAQRHQPWLMFVALRNGRSSVRMKGVPSVTFRRRRRTKVARESYMATSNWLPS